MAYIERDLEKILLGVEYFIIPNDEIKNLDEYLRENCFTLMQSENEDTCLKETKLINNSINLYRVVLSFFNEDEEIYKNFNNNLIDNKNDFKKIIKFYDDFHLKDLKKYQKEIFKIEMSLREIFTFIFLNRYPDSDNILSEYSFKNKDKFSILENEFFEFNFNDYIVIENKIKGLEIKDVLKILYNSENFDNFKEDLQERGIKEQKHIDFFLSIKENLGLFKEIRNRAMHNKRVFESDNDEVNYNKVKEKIKRRIEEFKQENFEEVKNG